jgi:hypothetical protein
MHTDFPHRDFDRISRMSVVRYLHEINGIRRQLEGP